MTFSVRANPWPDRYGSFRIGLDFEQVVLQEDWNLGAHVVNSLLRKVGRAERILGGISDKALVEIAQVVNALWRNGSRAGKTSGGISAKALVGIARSRGRRRAKAVLEAAGSSATRSEVPDR
jgi:hypothetical protein